jgi:hypothetical protein
VITAGTTVTYDRFTDVEMAQVLILGKLTFSRTAGTRLDTGNVIVERGGHLDMGTPTEPIPAFIDAELRLVTRPSGTCVGGPMFNANDVGLWVMPGGRWDAHGGAVRHTWVKLMGDVGAGATLLRVKENVSDWDPGSTILVTPTNRGPALNEFEEIQIARVIYAGDHSELFLTQPLRYAHAGGAITAAEVALLSRNVVVSSKYPTYPMNAHTMYMGTASGSIAYTEFRDLGMLGCLARYPVHFHMTGDASRGMSVRGASIWRSDNNFMNLHAANGVLVEDVVGYDTTGVGFFIGEPEPGMITVDNVFIHNLAAKIVFRPGALQGQQRASGFWIESRNSAIIDNVASGSDATSKLDSGFHFSGGTPLAPGFRPLVMVRNESHSNESNGLHAWMNSKDVFMVLDFRAWRNGRAGISWGAYTTRWQVHRAKLFENGEANLISSVLRMYIQDSELYGTSQFPTPTGIFIGGYFLNNDPTLPVRVVRNALSGHGTDLFQVHTPCTFGSSEELNPLSRDCSATYLVAHGNRFGSSRAIDFGWHQNANSWMLIRDWSGTGLPANFRLTRKDRPRPDLDAYYYAPFDAWLDPVAASVTTAVQGLATTVIGQSLGSSGTSSGARGGKTPRPTPTRTPAPGPTPGPVPSPATSALPPVITLLSPEEGSLLAGSMVLEAAASGATPIVKVEFFVDERVLATLTAAPYRTTWSTGSWTRKRAYVYACATDAVGNTACTTVAKVNRTAP